MMPAHGGEHLPRNEGLNAFAMHPTVLLISTLDWAGSVAARVAIALHDVGFAVAVLAPPNDVVGTAKPVSKRFKFRAWAPKQSIRHALQRSGARIVVPCDDPAVSLLHQIHAECAHKPSRSTIRNVIETSLGDPRSFHVTLSRSTLIEHAGRAGIRVPDTRVVPNIEVLSSCAAGLALPYMIKVDGSWGGMGVALVHGTDQALTAFARLTALSWARVVKRMIKGRSPAPLVAKLRPKVPTVALQQYIEGHPAHRVALCWEGEILAGISYEVMCVAYAAGPATVVRLIQHREMEQATARLVRRLRISGFCCCDFVIENGSDHAFLLELNPRATQTCHLVPADGKGLAAALFEHVTGTPTKSAPHPSISGVIALFAREWARDPVSPYLHSGYHDVPWSEPDLVLACMRLAKRRHWTDRVRDAIRGAQA